MIDPKNHVTLVVGLTDAPEVVNNDKIAKFRVAVDYSGKDSANADNKTGYFDVVHYRDENSPNSKFIFKQITDGNFKKGTQLILAGRLVQDRWTSEDGKKQSRVHVVAEAMTYAGSAGGGAPKADAGDAAPATLPDRF